MVKDMKGYRRDIRPVVVSYKGRSVTVDLPGYYPDGDGESIHVGSDMAVTDVALHDLKKLVGGITDDNRHDEVDTGPAVGNEE